jgi:hypothetical protein
MKPPRRRFLQLAGAAVAAPALPQFASAFDYPTHPVRVIVPYPPGGSNDILARLVGQGLSQRLGRQIVIENRPGGGTNIGTEAVVRAPPDGYTLLIVDNAAAINATLYVKLNFNFIHKHDSASRRVERLMRNALADGRLHAFVKARNGRIERLIEREEWRQEAFGIPGIDNISHHITNPGPDTEGQSVLLKISNFQEWLTTHRHAINPFRTGAPGKPSAIRIIEGEHQRRIARGEALDSVGKEAEYLKDYLDRNYPDAPQTTKKTIENRIRPAHRRRSPK